jgi:ribosome maturation factor RimP
VRDEHWVIRIRLSRLEIGSPGIERLIVADRQASSILHVELERYVFNGRQARDEPLYAFEMW